MHGIRVVGLSLQHLPVTRLRFGQFSRLVVHDRYAKESRNVRRNGCAIWIASNPKLGGSAASMAVHGRNFLQEPFREPADIGDSAKSNRGVWNSFDKWSEIVLLAIANWRRGRG